jgi:DNA-binding response OmpR family regulator
MSGTVYFLDPSNWSAGAAARLREAGFVVRRVPDRGQAERLMRRRPPDHVVVVVSPDEREPAALVEDLIGSAGSAEASLTLVQDLDDEELLYAAFAAGADDVVPPDCSPELLVARIRAVLRRTGALPEAEPRPVSIGAVTLDPQHRRVSAGGRQVHLTPLEFALLHTLMRDPGVVYSREDLLDAIWAGRDIAVERTIDAHVWKLRRKIEPDAAHPCYIRSVPGLGYRFVRPDAVTAGRVPAMAV